MAMIDRMSRAERRTIARLGRKERKAEPAMRYFIVAALGRGDSSPSVERMFEVARSTVVEVAKRFRAGGLAALRDRREGNGARKVPRQLQDPLVDPDDRSPQGIRRPIRPPLSASVLSRREPHGACLARPSRERDPQPPLRDALCAPCSSAWLRRRLPMEANIQLRQPRNHASGMTCSRITIVDLGVQISHDVDLGHGVRVRNRSDVVSHVDGRGERSVSERLAKA